MTLTESPLRHLLRQRTKATANRRANLRIDVHAGEAGESLPPEVHVASFGLPRRALTWSIDVHLMSAVELIRRVAPPPYSGLRMTRGYARATCAQVAFRSANTRARKCTCDGARQGRKRLVTL